MQKPLSDAVALSHQSLVVEDAPTSECIENDADHGQGGSELHLEGSALLSFDKAFVGIEGHPQDVEQDAADAQAALQRPVVVGKDAVEANGTSDHQEAEEGPHREVVSAVGVADPQVVHHRIAPHALGHKGSDGQA